MNRSVRRFLASSMCATALTGAAFVASPARAADAPKTPSITIDIKDTKLGPILVDGKGMSLYMFTPDAPNVSNCEGACLNVWPPLMLKDGESLSDIKLNPELRRSKLGVAMRYDGSRQVTYGGWPLYTWVRDKVPGDVTGQWVGNVWFVIAANGHPSSGRV